MLGGDPVVTLEGAVPLAKLYSTALTVFLCLLFLLSLTLYPLPYNNLSHSYMPLALFSTERELLQNCFECIEG